MPYLKPQARSSHTEASARVGMKLVRSCLNDRFKLSKGHFLHKSLVNPTWFTNVYLAESMAGIQNVMVIILGGKETLKIKPG